MSNISDLTKMLQLVELKYQKEQESFARLMAQENRLRATLQQLTQQLAESRSSNSSHLQAIGADVLWQAWVGRKKSELNLQLAQVLAIKERHIDQVRKAHGKMLVTQELLNQELLETRKKMARTQLDRAISSTLHSL